MNRRIFMVLSVALMMSSINSIGQESKSPTPAVDYRVDNMGYWRQMAEQGLVTVQPDIAPLPAIRKSSKIQHRGLMMDSPDVPVSDDGNDTQSEISVFVYPDDIGSVFNSNNSTGWNGSSQSGLFGTSSFYTDDFGESWTGTEEGAGGNNSGDPAAVISLSGRQYVGFIASNGGQGVSFSDDDGANWTSVEAGSPTGGTILDKNHLWIDNSLSSAHEGNLYNAWTDFNTTGGIFFVRSTDDGQNYSAPIELSSAVNAGSHNQGVNIQTASNGDVYVIWSIYDGGLTEAAIGMAKSTDGGATFAPATRIITNTRGIRANGVSKDHRVNSFPSMSIDISGGANDSNIYVFWSNIGAPGVNTGTNISVYMARSIDDGTTFETPIRVNQGTLAEGKEAYFPWSTCDPENGILSVIFYDDRDVAATQVEAWAANSYDGGDTWEDFRVSDVAFTPQPIAGLAGGYMGDYLGISARGGWVYPAWADNRNGFVQTFVSPYETNALTRPTDLLVILTNDVTGQTDLTWEFETSATFDTFVIYRDEVEVGTSTTTDFTDTLPDFGIYEYEVAARYTPDGESASISGSVQWGNAAITIDPTFLDETLMTDQMSVRQLVITNPGELPLTYDLNTDITTGGTTSSPLAFCTAGGGTVDEFIARVEFVDIDNSSGQQPYSDFTAISTDVDAGGTYPITITNGEVFADDDLGIWIDLNQDMDFDDPGEEVLCTINDGANGTYSITIPDGALGGTTTMRIRMKFNDASCGSPCGSTQFGEVEDYSLNISSWIQVGSTSGTIAPGDSETVNVNFDSTGLALGDYTATITFESNATSSPSVDVPVVLHVVLDSTVLAGTATASETEVCSGEPTTLSANANGGTGAYSYSWTSAPIGFTSNQANPIAMPTVTTTYTVEVDDGVDTIMRSVTVDVIDTPAQADTPVGSEEECQDAVNTDYTTNDVVNANEYAWSISPAAAGIITGTGTTGTVNWDETFSGTATISVLGMNDCGNGISSSDLTVTINELPNVTLDPFANVTDTTPPFALTGGTPTGGNYSGPGVTAGTFDPAAAGLGIHVITYEFSDGNGCSNIVDETIEVTKTLSVNDVENGVDFVLYPNPNNGLLNLEISSVVAQDFEVKLVSQLGQILMTEEIGVSNSDKHSFDLSNFASGIYYFVLTSNVQNYVKKIVVAN